jgi:organic radical activating enzyme
MSPKIFPINTSTACQLKWSWSTIRLYNGYTSSCHRASMSKITSETFDTFHNTLEKIDARNLMLQGKWPSGGCEYCKNIEDAGGSSDRQFHLAVPDQTPNELFDNPSETIVTPTVLEVYFDNTCNMSCIYCWDGFSSKIHSENLKFGRFEKNGIIIQNSETRTSDFDKLTAKLWDWLHRHHKKLKRFHVLGGEPFYQAQFLNCLEFFENHPSPDLEFNVVTNLMLSSERLQLQIDKIKQLVDNKKIKRFDLTVSIDCFGKEQEYVRYGLDLDQWRKNFEYVVQQPWVYLNINQTITALTIKTMPDLINYINSFKSLRNIGHYFSMVVSSHKCLHPEIFGPNFFSQDFDKILNCMRQDTWQEKQAFKYMMGIRLQLEAGHQQPDKIKQLGTLLDEIDRRRNLNWKNVFPWLQQEIKNVV